MIDFIVMEARIEPFIDFNSSHPFKWKGILFCPKYKGGKLKGFECEYEGLRVVLYYDKINISNSIHKFYKGNNYTDFSYSQLRDAINKICQKFEIDATQWIIKKMEFGFNIHTPEQAHSYLELFLEYKNREFEKMKYRHHDYGRKCFWSEYALKVYDKHFQSKIMDSIIIPNNILRVEFCFNQKRKLPKQIQTLSDLLDQEKFRELFKVFKEAFGKIIFNDEIDFTNSTINERLLFYASLNPNFLKVEERINKTEAKAIKPKINRLKERFFRKEFKQWFLKALSDKYIELYCS